MKYFVYSFKKAIDEILPFMLEAQKEIYPEEEEWKREYWRIFEENPLNYAIVVFDKGIPVGFSFVVICRKDRENKLFATNSALYLDPRVRGYAGGKLIRISEEVAKTRGASEFEWDVIPGSDMDRMLEKRYKKHSIIYSRDL